MQATVGNSVRSSSATAYLAPALANRSNLDVLIHTQVTRLLQTGKNGSIPIFRGVEFAQGPTGLLYIRFTLNIFLINFLESRYNVTALKEVVLSAGSIGTPQLLMLSGIGDSSALTELGIQPIVDLPDVGTNFQDHPIVPVQWLVNSNNTYDILNQDPAVMTADLAEYHTNGTGPLANVPVSNQMGFFRLPNTSSILQKYGDPSAGPNAPHYELTFGVSRSDIISQ